VPILEIVTLICQDPTWQDVAVLGYPRERARVVLARGPDSTLDLPGVSEFLLTQGIPEYFLPERLELMQALLRR
jgi:hypothetical protein